MRGRRALLIVLVMLVGSPVYAAETKTYGNWLVSVDRDRFDDTQSNVIALLPDVGNQHFLAVRCLSGNLSFAIGGDQYTKGDTFLVKFRGDQQPIIDTSATALSEKMIEVNTTSDMFEELKGAKEYAFRLLGNTSIDMIFHGGSGAAKALAEVSKACSGEAK